MRKSLGALLGMCALLSACGDERKPRSDGDAAVSDAATGDSGAALGDGSIMNGSLDAALSDASIDGGGGGDASSGAVIPSNDGGPFVLNDAGQLLCGNVACACADGIDQDLDGLFDLADPECVSPWDNDETSFATGISGDNRDDACQDCFFDGNSGAGDDGCRLPSSCLITGLPTSGQGSCNSCVQSDQCKNFCQKYTPNGCDCFGCCTVNLGSNITRSVLLTAACNIDGTSVSPECTTCVPSTTCVNTCGRCELCPGKELSELPADCTASPVDGGTVPADGGVAGGDAGTGTPVPSCDNGEVACRDQSACTSYEACVFGCCIQTPLL